ncbi:hypothetical protein GCM10011506_37210 [Marivirga lumbricoides]|uniref:Nucleotide pyrophosphatase n=1 Tax=Marivirga lumbricoides TaxID=1046115 RepID=A0ABQ1MWQ6_9BACT|nr:hypothetical protein GCM10011506_37210 [Marivirga lumbricoides]
MHHTKVILAIIFLGVSIQLYAQKSSSVNSTIEPEKKVVFIIVDGIAPDMLKKANTPFLDQIAQEGSYSEATVGGNTGTYSETPTISAVGYNSLLTGVWVNKHNVFGNSIKNPNYNYPTIFNLLSKSKPELKTAIFSTWLDNRTKLVGENLLQTDSLQIDYAFDGFELDEERFPHDKERVFIKNIDELVANEATRYIKEESPDLSWVYLEFSDDIGHKFGDSHQLDEAIAFEDKLIGQIAEAVKYRESIFHEDWLLLITTDHGRTAFDGKHHGGQSDRERSTWIITNHQNTNSYFRSETPSIVDLLPTMVSFLEIDVAEKVKFEWDGVSLTDPVEAINLTADVMDQTIKLTWKALDLNNNSTAQIYGSTTNNFKNGGEDNYEFISEIPLNKEYTEIPLSQEWKKIILKTKHHTLNTWIIYNN